MGKSKKRSLLLGLLDDDRVLALASHLGCDPGWAIYTIVAVVSVAVERSCGRRIPHGLDLGVLTRTKLPDSIIRSGLCASGWAVERGNGSRSWIEIQDWHLFFPEEHSKVLKTRRQQKWRVNKKRKAAGEALPAMPDARNIVS